MDQTLEQHVVGPLVPFYRTAGEPMPTVRIRAGSTLPEPYRELLSHEQDMTSKLEAYVDQSLSLTVLDTRDEDGDVCREVVLMSDGDGQPVEFGAIRIYVDRIPLELARIRVREGHRPLGRILREHGIKHRCCPTGFFEVDCDRVMRDALGITGEHVLYGRHNLLYLADESQLAEVTEILPPL